MKDTVNRDLTEEMISPPELADSPSYTGVDPGFSEGEGGGG